MAKARQRPTSSSATRPPVAPPAAMDGTALLAAALEAQSEGVLILDRRWTDRRANVLFANSAFRTMTGLSDATLRRSGLEALHATKADLARLRRWHRAPEPGKAFQGEGYLLRKNGAVFYAAWTFSPVRDSEGRITHFVATYRDINDKRGLQEALLHAQRLDAVGRLAGGVAHDFNNLLSVIHGYCEILGSRPAVRAKAAHELHEIHQATQKASALVRQLLAFSRRQTMTPKVLDLNQLIRENADILTKLLQPDKSLVLALEASEGRVRIDPSQLQQVLLNLTLNARDALREGGQVTIGTAIRQVSPGLNRRTTDLAPGRYVVLSVNDNGAGMDAHTQAHLFEPFFTTKAPGAGTGLGLSLVYGVVQQSGGTILVHSAPAVGTTFEIFLPEAREAAEPAAPRMPALPTTHGRESVLVIEEDAVIRKMIAGILTADGYKVSAHANASEARKRARGAFDLLILDPGRRASEAESFAAELVNRLPNLRVLTTCNGDSRQLPGIPRASQHCIAKPFALSALIRAGRTLLDLPTKPAVSLSAAR